MAWGGPALLIPSYVVKCYSWKIPRKPCRGECRTTRPPPQLTLPIEWHRLQSVRLWLHSAQLKTAHPEVCATKNSAALALLVRLLRFVDVHVLGVNDFARRRGARPGLRPARR